MRVLVLGGDGFCGWPTTLRLLSNGMEVCIVDNLARRSIDTELHTKSLTPIASIQQRIECASKLIAPLTFVHLDVALDYNGLENLIRKFKPTAIVQFAEQRSAPYSMIGDRQRRYTVNNNITGTHNVCSAIVNVDRDIHLIHLGTMGVYGYTKSYGPIPEGYLDVTIKSTSKDASILYPANPGSIYHMTKCLDQLIFSFYNKNWGLKITDLHQGIVWGVNTRETMLDPLLVNRFDYDGVYGTVLNRFICQAANNVPLTVYGTGGQTRAFIHIDDTAECVKLAIQNHNFDYSSVRIFNQVAETKKLADLAEIIVTQYGGEVAYIENPRKELAENELEVSNLGLVSLGFKPILLDKSLVDDVHVIASMYNQNFDSNLVLNSPVW